jgi:hypothetical protein
MMIRLGFAYLCLHMCVFLAVPPSVYASADQVVEYLTILQSLTVAKPPVSTPEQRKRFCNGSSPQKSSRILSIAQHFS